MAGIKEFPNEYTACPTNTSEHHTNTHQRRLKHINLLNMILMIVTWVIVISALIVQIHVVRKYDTPDQSNQTCLKCKTLSRIIERWAWKNVSEETQIDTCCFNSDTGLAATLKYYFEKRFSRSLSEIERLQEKVDQLSSPVLNHLLSNRTNTTAVHPNTKPDLSTLIQLNNNIFNRKRSVLHLTSVNTIIAEDSDPKICWASTIKQGNISLCNDTCSVSIMSTGIYRFYTQVKYRANFINSQTMNTTAQFFLATLREGQLYHVDAYKKQWVFRESYTEHDADLHTMARLEAGDKLFIRFPRSQKPYLASERGAHRISIFKIS